MKTLASNHHQIFTLFLSVLLTVFMTSCGDGTTEKDGETEVSQAENGPKEERVLFPEISDTVLAKLRATPQEFKVDASKDTVIQGTSGVRVSIGANVFQDENGTPVTDVKIELVEAIDVQSFIDNDLVTLSGDQLLESGGMFYVNATSNGKNVSIKNNEALTLSIPSSSIMGDMGIFYGSYKGDQKLDWEPVKGVENMKMDFNMTALPLKHLDYKGRADDLEGNFLFGHPTVVKEIRSLNDPKYEGTFIATQEFSERLGIHVLGAFTNPNKNTFKEVIGIYKKHIDGNLWEADQEVVEYLTPHYNDLIRRMDDKKDNSLGLAKNFKEFGEICWDQLESLPKAKYTRPIDFRKLGITSNTTKEDLIKQGISPADADRYLFMYDEYNSANTFAEVKSYTVSVTKMGWVNIDRFLNDPACQESKITVTVDGADSSTVKLMMVFPLRNICVQAINKDGNKYSFTNKSGLYRKLPIGEEAVIIALSSKNGKPYFGTTTFSIPEEGNYTVRMSESTLENIKVAMGQVLKANRPDM